MPWLTCGLLAAMVAVQAWPGLAPWLVYERTAVEAGETWRLLGAHGVHFTGRHLLASGGALALAGWGVERRGGPMLLLALGGALVVGLAIHALAPEVRLYAGSSGVACAVWAWLALDLARGDGLERTVSCVAIASLAPGLALEAATGGGPLVAGPGVASPLALAHAVGATFGAGLALGARLLVLVGRTPEDEALTRRSRARSR